MIVLDTSVLIDCLTGSKLSAPAVREIMAVGEPILLPALVLYEWLRGSRLLEELTAQVPIGVGDSVRQGRNPHERRFISGREPRPDSGGRFGNRRVRPGAWRTTLDAEPC